MTETLGWYLIDLNIAMDSTDPGDIPDLKHNFIAVWLSLKGHASVHRICLTLLCLKYILMS